MKSALIAGLLTVVVAGCAGGTVNGPTPPAGAATATPGSVAATDTPGPTVTFKAIALSGKGSKVPKFTIPDGAAAIAVVSYKGSGNFAIESLAADGSDNDLLVNTIGGYTGTVLFDAQAGQHSVAFKVTATGSWTATIKPVTSARTWSGSGKLTGTGDDVVQIVPAASGLVTLAVSGTGTGNFAVVSFGLDGGENLLVNEIGHYSGEVQLPDQAALLQVTADGPWSVAEQ